MKTLACLPLLLIMSIAANSQNILYTPSGGAFETTGGAGIGINNSQPTARLHINENTHQGTAFKIDLFYGMSDGVLTWIPENAFLVNSTDQGFPSLGTQQIFKVDRMGNTDIGGNTKINGKLNVGLSAAAPERFAVFQSFGLYNSTVNHVKLRYSGGAQPEFLWTTSNNRNFRFMNSNNNTIPLTLSPAGKVGINTENFVGTHSLYVKGTTIAEEIFVKIEDDWADYVFDEEYDLIPLEKLEAFIQQNKHLPGMPTAEQIAETGIPIGKVERILTEKVEELTLYLIALNKEVESLKVQLEVSKSKNE